MPTETYFFLTKFGSVAHHSQDFRDFDMLQKISRKLIPKKQIGAKNDGFDRTSATKTATIAKLAKIWTNN